MPDVLAQTAWYEKPEVRTGSLSKMKAEPGTEEDGPSK